MRTLKKSYLNALSIRSLSAAMIVSASFLSACSKNVEPGPELEYWGDSCKTVKYASQTNLKVPGDDLFRLIGKPTTIEAIDTTIEVSPIFRGHLVEQSNAAVLKGESLIVNEATWHFGPCRLTVWLWPEEDGKMTAFSSIHWHKDSLF